MLQQPQSKSYELSRQLFVRLAGFLATLLSGCLVLALVGSPSAGHGPVQLVPAFLTLVSGLGGIVLGVYVASALFPATTARGALTGAVSAAVITFALTLAGMVHQEGGGHHHRPLPMPPTLPANPAFACTNFSSRWASLDNSHNIRYTILVYK